MEHSSSPTVKLTPHNRQTVTIGRRHLFTHMVRTGTAFWAWSKRVWIEVIEAAPVETKNSGTRFWMINLAYLFCDFLYVGASTTYGLMASTLFGSSLVEAEIEKLRTPVANIGYWGGWDWNCSEFEGFEYREIYYNRKRRHSSLAYLSPVQYEKQGKQRRSDDT